MYKNCHHHNCQSLLLFINPTTDPQPLQLMRCKTTKGTKGVVFVTIFFNNLKQRQSREIRLEIFSIRVRQFMFNHTQLCIA